MAVVLLTATDSSNQDPSNMLQTKKKSNTWSDSKELFEAITSMSPLTIFPNISFLNTGSVKTFDVTATRSQSDRENVKDQNVQYFINIVNHCAEISG